MGNTADGSLTVDGETALTTGGSFLGYAAGVTGTATITGSKAKWSSTSTRYIGFKGNGVLNVTGGGYVSDSTAYLGYNAGSTGTATVDGAGSTWANTGDLNVGYNGTGGLNILNGAAVSATGVTTVGKSGSINFGPNGGTLITGTLYASGSQLSGTGIINTSGFVGDADLVFNAAQGAAQTQMLTMNGVTVNLTQSSAKVLGVGYLGAGTMSISDGVKVTSNGGYLGYNAGSIGTATIDGAGSAWNSTSTLTVGKDGTGILNIFNGAEVSATGATTVGKYGTINFGSNGGTLTTGTLYASGSQLSGTGTINTSGFVGDEDLVFNAVHSTAQTLTMNGVAINLTQSSANALGVGYLGTGTMSISDGVKVASNGGYFGYLAGSTGTATISGTGSSWASSGIISVGPNGTGVLTITNGGSASTTSTLNIGTGSTGVGTVAVDGTGSTVIARGLNMASGGSSGTLYITNGGTVTVANDSDIYDSSSTYIGSGTKGGSATVIITNGGKLLGSTSGSAFTGIGYGGGTGIMTVDGIGSTWRAGYNNTAYVGYQGMGNLANSTARLSINDGALVTAGTIYINDLSILTTDVGKGSSLNVGSGTGTITNNGTIRLAAGAEASVGTYTPMSYGTMTMIGTGKVQTLGGVWDRTAHTVVVSAASTAAGNGGSVASFNTATTQRALVTDSATGKSVGAGFQAGTSDLTFGATAISGSELTSLQGLLADGKSVLSGWDFSTTGTTVSASNPAYLSLWAGDATSLSDMALWKYVDGIWSQFTGAYDLAYDGTYASFTATDLNTWAVTGTSPVPVPGAVWLLGSGVLGLVGFRKRNGLKA